MQIHWGRYKGEHIVQIPFNYLKWLAKEFPDDEVGVAAEKECLYRLSIENK